VNHSEFLVEAQKLYDELAIREEELEQSVVALTAKTVSQAQEIASLKAEIASLNAEIVVLKAKIKQLEDQLNPPTTQPTTPPPTPPPTTQPTTPPPTQPPPQPWLWNDEFATVPDDARYIRAGFEPDTNFVLASPGNMDCVFVTGKIGGPHASGASNKVLRSELLIRVPGTNNAWREDVGKDYVNEFAFTLPQGYAPAAGNETNLVNQYWQEQSVKPPIQLQLIDPATTPDPLILRIVLSAPAFGSIPAKNEIRPWKMPIVKGSRYEVVLRTRWRINDTGLIVLSVNGQEKFRQEAAPTCYDFAQGMAPHLGQYQPGSHDEVAGVKTTVRFHHWRIRLA
jgi:polysaccharide lyase-like protein